MTRQPVEYSEFKYVCETTELKQKTDGEYTNVLNSVGKRRLANAKCFACPICATIYQTKVCFLCHHNYVLLKMICREFGLTNDHQSSD